MSKRYYSRPPALRVLEAMPEHDWYATARQRAVASETSAVHTERDLVRGCAEHLGLPDPWKTITRHRAGSSEGYRQAYVYSVPADLRALIQARFPVGNLSKRTLTHGRAEFSCDAAVQLILVADRCLYTSYLNTAFDAAVSTSAFPRIRQPHKTAAVREMLQILRPGGGWLLDNLTLKYAAAEQEALTEYGWLDEECFARRGEVQPLCEDTGGQLNARQWTPVMWVLRAYTPGTCRLSLRKEEAECLYSGKTPCGPRSVASNSATLLAFAGALEVETGRATERRKLPSALRLDSPQVNYGKFTAR